jgi:uncharacterized protein (DUF1778 family)
MAAKKPYRRASEQFLLRATPEEAALIRAAFTKRGELTSAGVSLLVQEAKARLSQHPALSGDEGRPAA